jgi:hypothetical protein
MPAECSKKSEWQRRYDDSIAREQTRLDEDGITTGEVAASQASFWLPGWLGFIGLAVTWVVVALRRRSRR